MISQYYINGVGSVYENLIHVHILAAVLHRHQCLPISDRHINRNHCKRWIIWDKITPSTLNIAYEQTKPRQCSTSPLCI